MNEWFGYRWFCLRLWWRGLPERMAWALAFRLPKRVALFAFVRVYGVIGECGPDYGRVYDAWVSKHGR